LEELSIRAGISLSQKKIVQELTTEGEDDDFEREYHALSAQVDKVTLKMFAATVEAGKLERALDLVERLHIEKSYELAMAIADSHRKLVDLIEDAKERKFPPVEEDYFEDAESPDFTDDVGQPRISPDGSSVRKGKRPFDDSETREVRQKQTYA
jgi:chromosome transmission fidelity protein 4